MKGKLVLKRLSASDLTIFEFHYRNTAGTKQKAINLDAAVFIATLFPGLPNRLDFSRDRVVLTLTLLGPGITTPHTITRKILKQQKNWRLNGELISNPPEEPSRYDNLQKGDYALISFDGDLEPKSAHMYLVGKGVDEDKNLFDVIDKKYGSGFSDHKGMEQISQNDFCELLESIELPSGHPIVDLFDVSALEDASYSGIEGVRKLQRRRKVRGVSTDEFTQAKRNAEKIGYLGEEIVNTWLENRYADNATDCVIWESSVNAISSFDFTILRSGKPFRRLDVKSTSGDFSNKIHISMAELFEIAQGDCPYDLYRVYNITDQCAYLRIASDLKNISSTILSSLSNLPYDISIDSFSIDPQILPFGEEVTIYSSSE